MQPTSTLPTLSIILTSALGAVAPKRAAAATRGAARMVGVAPTARLADMEREVAMVGEEREKGGREGACEVGEEE